MRLVQQLLCSLFLSVSGRGVAGGESRRHGQSSGRRAANYLRFHYHQAAASQAGSGERGDGASAPASGLQLTRSQPDPLDGNVSV